MKALCLCLLSLPCFAQTYDFSDGTIQGTVTLAGTTVTAYSFDRLLNSTMEAYSASPASPIGVTSSFALTVSNGAITTWDIVLQGNQGIYADDHTNDTMHLTGTGDTQLLESSSDGCSPCYINYAGSAGTWTKEAPEINAGSAASSLTLLAGLLALMYGFKPRGRG